MLLFSPTVNFALAIALDREAMLQLQSSLRTYMLLHEGSRWQNGFVVSIIFTV